MKKLTSNVIQFAEKRGISQKTLEDMRCESGSAQFGDRKLESLVFGYYNSKGERVIYKARAIQEKAFKQQTGGKQQFYNLGNVLNSKNLDTVYITEGEMDLCSLIESGFSINSVLSVPGGAPATPTEEAHNTKRYQFRRLSNRL